MSRPLIDITELAQLLADRDRAEPVVLLDVRWRLGGPAPAELYRSGHLPGAVAVDLDRDLAGEPGPRGRHPLPDPVRLQSTLQRWGIGADSPVIAYDDADGSSAARAWWLLRWAGHTDVRVLDGGLAAWTAAGRPLTTEVPAPTRGDVEVRPGGMPTLDPAAAAATARDGVLLDARSPERYRGETEPVDPVAGHIPGAVSAPIGGNVGPDGRFRSAAELRDRFAAAGVHGGTAATTVGAYCGSGVTAAQQVLALAVAGVDAALYVGSWSEWVADPSRPVATGAEPG